MADKTYTIYDPLVDAYRQVTMSDEQAELYYTSAVKVKEEKDAASNTSNS